MDENKMTQQPSEQQQTELKDIENNVCEEVKIPHTSHSYKVYWLHFKTIDKLTDLMLREKDEHKRNIKAAAMIVVNRRWKFILGFYAVLWRLMYYVYEYTDIQVRPILEAAKKKIPLADYYLNTISLIGIKDTIAAMTKEEVELYRQGLAGEQPTP